MIDQSSLKRLPGKVTKPWVLGILLVLFACGQPAHADSTAELLERGIYLEETKGDLAAASEIYRQIEKAAKLPQAPATDRPLVVLALERLKWCEWKLGHKPQASLSPAQLTSADPDDAKSPSSSEDHIPHVLDELLRQIEQTYLEPVDRKELIEAAIKAIVAKLSERSDFLKTNDVAFLGTNDMNELKVNIEQKVAGIGARLLLDRETHAIMVETALQDSPALKAGLQAGDRIISVDGTNLPEKIELEAAVKLMRGMPGEPITLGVQRPATNGLIEFKLVREIISLQSVTGDHYRADQTWEFMMDMQRKVGYLRLTQIGAESSKEMMAAMVQLKAEGMTSLILDLRNNPGGWVPPAVEVAALFVDSGEIVSIKGRTYQQAYTATPEDTFMGFPMAVLVNRNTASAAEIIAACLQDHDRAAIVGERTYGQGLMRTLIKLQDGEGALRLPVAAYYRPNGKSINRYPNSKDSDDWGVRPTPGCEVTMTEDELAQFEKSQDAKQILNKGPVPPAEFQDRPLQKALEWIKVQLAKK